MTSLLKLPDHNLAALDDDKLIEHIRRAFAHDEPDYAKRALNIFVFRYHARVVALARKKIPRADYHDVANQAILDAIDAHIQGTTAAEVRGLIFKIAHRRIADYHRKPRHETRPLPEEQEGDEAIFGETPSVDDDTAEQIDERDCFKQVLTTLNPVHKKVVWLRLIEGYPSDSVAEKVNSEFPNHDPPMNRNNVDKITSRFREARNECLAENHEESNG